MNLLPCPFCGHAHPQPHDLTSNLGIKFFIVLCPECGAEGPSDSTEQAAMERWNKRPYREQIQAVIQTAMLDAAAAQLFKP